MATVQFGQRLIWAALAVVSVFVGCSHASEPLAYGDPIDPSSPDAYIMPVRPLIPADAPPTGKRYEWKVDAESGIQGVGWPVESKEREFYVRGPAEWTLKFEGDRSLVVRAREAECERKSDRATKLDGVWFDLELMSDEQMEEFLDDLEKHFPLSASIEGTTGRAIFRKWKENLESNYLRLLIGSRRNFPSITLTVNSSRLHGKLVSHLRILSIEPMLPETQIAAYEAVKAGNCDEALKLIDSRPKANWARYVPSGQTVLHEAAEQGCLPVIERLTKAGVSVDQRDDLKRTPLASAFLAGRLDVAEALLEKGADINAQLAGNRTILHIVAEHDVHALPQSELIAWALDHGVDPSLRMYDGKTALDLALRREHTEAVRLLRAAERSRSGRE